VRRSQHPRMLGGAGSGSGAGRPQSQPDPANPPSGRLRITSAAEAQAENTAVAGFAFANRPAPPRRLPQPRRLLIPRPPSCFRSLNTAARPAAPGR
jgi:hypothetical protein